MKRKTKIIALWVLVAMAAALVVLLIGRFRTGAKASASYVTRPIGQADIVGSVSETGIINPVNQVLIGSEVSGTIRSITVDYNSRVRKGQILATMDQTTFLAAVQSAEASLKLAQANLLNAQVNREKAQAQLDQANLAVQRDAPLADKGMIAQSQLEAEQSAARTAALDLQSTASAIQVAEAQATVVRAQLDQAKYNLSRTVITSPMDGMVMSRNVSVGQTVSASLQAPTLFTLVSDMTNMQVDTSVDEADIGSVKTGQAAKITVTAFPNKSFSGRVQQVRINPTVSQNVVTYDAVISVKDPAGRLLPGMSAQVSIETGRKAGVLAIPLAALLYRPTAASAQSQAPGGGLGGGGGFGQGVANAADNQSVAGAPGSRVSIWILREGRPSMARVVIGISDGSNVEITGGEVKAGDLVIVAQRRGRN
jgi:HlyD family secretion protein